MFPFKAKRPSKTWDTLYLLLFSQNTGLPQGQHSQPYHNAVTPLTFTSIKSKEFSFLVLFPYLMTCQTNAEHSHISSKFLLQEECMDTKAKKGTSRKPPILTDSMLSHSLHQWRALMTPSHYKIWQYQ